MAQNTDNTFTFIASPGMILCYPHLITPRAFQDKGKPKGDPKYGAQFIIAKDSTDWNPFVTHCVNVAREAWPTLNLKTEVNPKKGWPWRSGDLLADNAKERAKGEDINAFMRGKWVIRTSSGQDFPPLLCGFEPGRKGTVDYLDEVRKSVGNKFKPGMLVLAKVNVRAQKFGDDRYVVAYLNMVCSTGKIGADIRMQKSSAEVFSGYQGHVTNEDPTGGEQFGDDMPF